MKDGKVSVIEDEAERVRMIYQRYLELGGVNALVRELRERNIRTKSRLLATGATRGGVVFGRGSLFYLLRNRFYIGEVKYKDEILPGEQPAIMDRALFDAVQQKLTDQWTNRTTRLRRYCACHTLYTTSEGIEPGTPRVNEVLSLVSPSDRPKKS